MTIDEAIKIIKVIDRRYMTLEKEERNALEMAINALEREQKFLDAGYKNGRVEFMIGGRKFMVKEMAQ